MFKRAYGCICLALLALLLMPVDGGAQGLDCIGMVRSIYRKMTGVSDGARICRAAYTVRTTMRGKGSPAQTESKVEMLANSGRLQVVSREFEIYQDATTSVMVMPARRAVYVSTSNLSAFRETRGKLISALQDTLFAISTVAECASISDARSGEARSGADRRVKLVPPPHVQRRLQIASFTLFIDSKEQMIRKISVATTADNRVASLDIVFDAIEYDYRSDAFSRPLLTQFLDGKGKLLPKYAGYSLVDSRRGAGGR